MGRGGVGGMGWEAGGWRGARLRSPYGRERGGALCLRRGRGAGVAPSAPPPAPCAGGVVVGWVAERARPCRAGVGRRAARRRKEKSCNKCCNMLQHVNELAGPSPPPWAPPWALAAPWAEIACGCVARPHRRQGGALPRRLQPCARGKPKKRCKRGTLCNALAARAPGAGRLAAARGGGGVPLGCSCSVLPGARGARAAPVIRGGLPLAAL